MKLIRFATVVSVMALIGAWFVNRALPTQASGFTLSVGNPVIKYTHGPFVVPNVTDQVGPPACSAPQSCDQVPLKITVPQGYDAKNQVTIRFDYDQKTVPVVDFDIWVYNSRNEVIASNTSGSSPSIVTIPATTGNYTVTAVPWFPAGETYTATITLGPKAPATKPTDGATQATGIAPRYQDFNPPSTVGGTTAGEPSIGVNWKTGNALFISDLQQLKVQFNDSTSPAQSTWTDVSAPTTSKESLDPILFTDHTTGRTFASQLTGVDSLSEYTDDDGKTWTPSQGGGIPSGVDHQSIGDGPYSASGPAILHPLYPMAVYYCSQDIAAAFCARSDDGGLTYGAGVPIYTIQQCAGIHGHVKVAPDGTVYVPARSCGGGQAVAVSSDDGTTWSVRPVPHSTAAIGNDPSVGIGTDGTVYFGFQGADGHARVAVSHDKGLTWTTPVDVGALASVQNSVFPAVVAGDANRAAFAYLGSTTGGDFQQQNAFNGIWYLYVSTTYDGGKTWTTVNATPDDPVQRGSICVSGTTCTHTPDDRNLLDFIDATIDKNGRVLVGFADGCVNACVAGTAAADPSNTSQSPQSQLNSFTALASIARQSGGRSLFAKFDKAQPTRPARPALSASHQAANGPILLQWHAPDNGGAAITSYKLSRGTAPGAESFLANVGTHVSYVDKKVTTGTTYYYTLVASNSVGSSPASPEVAVSPSNFVDPKPMCSLPGALAIGDPDGDQTGNPQNADLDITGLYVAQIPNTHNLSFTLSTTDLSTLGSYHQWRIFWDSGTSGNRWYVGMDTDVAGTPSFMYGANTGQDTGVKYAPGVPTTSIPGLAGSQINADKKSFTVVVPESGVGNPVAGNTLPDLQARTFAAQGGVITASQTLAIDYTGFGSYTLVADKYCTG